MSKIIFPPQIYSELTDYFLFLDTNVFIHASKNKDFFDFLVKFNIDHGCTLFIIPSALFEFTQGSATAKDYQERTDFVVSLCKIDGARFISDISDFQVVMSKVNGKNKSYTDFLLAAAVYQYRRLNNVALLTTDINMFPSFFNRSHIITVDRTKELVNFGVYQFENDSYIKAARAALNEVS